jgi:hypothetical protein
MTELGASTCRAEKRQRLPPQWLQCERKQIGLLNYKSTKMIGLVTWLLNGALAGNGGRRYRFSTLHALEVRYD